MWWSILLTITVGTVVYFYIKYKHSYWQKRGIPSIPCHWLFGNAKDAVFLRKSPSIVIGDLYQKASENDDVLGIYMFHKPFLLLRNPDIIKQILVKDFDVFSDRYFNAKSFHDQIGSTNLFTLRNPEWRYLRTKLTPIFTSGKIKKLFHLLTETADSMEKYLQDQFQNDMKTKKLDAKDITLKYTTDIISTVAFGITVNSFDSYKMEFFKKVQQGLQTTLSGGIQFFIMFFFPLISPYIGGKMLGTSTSYFRKVFWDSIDSREVSKVKRGDLIDSLVELKNDKQDNNFKFEGDTLLAQSAIFFIAGRDSSVTTMTYTFYELARHQNVQKRLREEIKETIEKQGITYDSLQNMKYLRQVVSEILRLYPTAPLLDRVAKKNYQVPGTNIVIEKGTPIYVPLTGLHRDPRFFPDPDRFDPERFSDENKHNIKPFTYMPFGEGPRVCIGMRLGLLQTSMGIISIIKDYELSIDPTCTYDIDRRNIFLTPPSGFMLNFTKI